MPFVTLGGGSHDNLSGVSTADHHTATVAGDLDHQDLANRGSGDHHQDLPALFTNNNDIIARDNVGAIVRRALVTQAQAEAGADINVKAWSPQRVGQAVVALQQQTEMVRSVNVAVQAVAVTWPTAFGSAPSIVSSYFTTSTASRHSHAKTSSTTAATLFGNENAEPLDVLAMLVT